MPDTTRQPYKATNLSLEHLIALNDEIASFVRAGVPLDRGLLVTGRDMPGRLGRLTTAVAIELSHGVTLDQAIASDRVDLPPVYRAVVSAGIRSGRLSAALESVSTLLRRLAESRREVTSSLIYPVLIVALAWCLGYGLFIWLLPMFHEFLTDATFGRSPLTHWLPAVSNAWHWMALIPLLLIIATFRIWYSAGQATFMQNHASFSLLDWMPWMGRMIRMSRTAAFIDVLALMVENEIPLHEAVVLAAESTGQRQMIHSARDLAHRLEAGEPLDRQHLDELAIPPMLAWMIASGLRHRALLTALRHAAKTYHRRATRAADYARIFLPVLFTLAIGGTAVVIAAFGLFLPYICLLHEMSKVW